MHSHFVGFVMRRLTYTYNITGRGATGTNFHCTLEENVITVIELEHIQIDIVTLDQRNTGVNTVEISAQ